jgi:phosphate transport system permease protein
VAATVPLVMLVAVVAVLGIKALPSIKVNGLHFFTGSSWKPGSTYGSTVHTNGVAHPMGSSYGIWPLIVGTLQTSAIAVVLAVPISLGAAFALTERLPSWLSRPLALAIEILAGIPSVIIGLWGVLTLGPLLAQHVYPIVANHMPDVPVLRYFRNPTGHGEGLATSGLVLTLMIVPIITATTRDLFNQVPPLPQEGAVALGMTDAEVARRVTIPWVRSGIIGATVLGLGRALGETIAMAMITGAALNTISPNIYGTMGTIAAAIVTQLDSAYTDGTGFAISALAEAALVLAVITVAVNVVARLIISRTSRNGAPVGRAVL